jgi:hypothetical protein
MRQRLAAFSGLALAAAGLTGCAVVGEVPLPVAPAPSAAPATLTASELAALETGPHSVARPLAFWHRGRKYVGALGYSLVGCEPEAAFRLGYQSESLGEWVANAGLTVVSRDEHSYVVDLVQSQEPMLVTVPVRVTWQGHLARFELARGRPSGIEDLWGFLLAEPYGEGRTLLISSVVVDLGPGLLRGLTETYMQQVLMRTAGILYDHLAFHGC